MQEDTTYESASCLPGKYRGKNLPREFCLTNPLYTAMPLLKPPMHESQRQCVLWSGNPLGDGFLGVSWPTKISLPSSLVSMSWVIMAPILSIVWQSTLPIF